MMSSKVRQNAGQANIYNWKTVLHVLGDEAVGIAIQALFWLGIGTVLWICVHVPVDWESKPPPIAKFATELYQFKNFLWELGIFAILLVVVIPLNAKRFILKIQEELSRIFYVIGCATLTLAIVVSHWGRSLSTWTNVGLVVVFCFVFGLGLSLAARVLLDWRSRF